jgi:hypothetical protein
MNVMKRGAAKLVLGVVALLGVSAAVAFVLSPARWRGGTTTLHISIPGTAPSGGLYKDALAGALLKWNETPFRFVIDDSYVDPCTGYSRSSTGRSFPAGDGDSRNSIDFRADVCGNDFGSDVLAITLNLSTPGKLGFEYLVESDIIFNTAFNWSIYGGPRRTSVDFGRVALHELGHVLGLSHELGESAIMAPKVSDIDSLTADDRAGALRLYGAPTTCPITGLVVNSLTRASLVDGDCRVQQLYSNGTDTSLVDTYRLVLTQPTALRLRMSSTSLDSVLLITDEQLNPVEAFDDSIINGTTTSSCDVDEALTLPAGTYLLLANTFVRPEKCAGNSGNYTLAVSDSPFPLLGNTGNTRSGGTLAAALFSGHTRLDTETRSSSSFTATDRITVEGRINLDPAHVGKPGRIFVLATLSDGKQFMLNSVGNWPVFRGVGTMVPAWTGTLDAVEDLTIIRGLRGSTTGLSGLGFSVNLGYALDASPQDIHYGVKPIAFQIAR